METKPAIKNMNKPAYLVFLLTGIIFLILKDFSQVLIFWGLALVFDPFNINTSFKKRPLTSSFGCTFTCVLPSFWLYYC